MMDTLVGMEDMRESAKELGAFITKVLTITDFRTLTSIAPPFHGTTFRGLTTILKGLNFYDTLATLTDQLCPAYTWVVGSSPILQELRTKERNPSTIRPAPGPKGSQDGGEKYLVVMTAKDKVITPWTSG